MQALSIVCALLVLNIMVYGMVSASVIDDLFEAINNGDIAIVKDLITKDPTLVRAAPRYNACQTPLHVAASRDQQEIAQLLIEHGALIDAPDEYGYKPVDFAKNDVMKNLLLGKALVILSARSNFFKDIMGITEINFKNNLHDFADKITHSPIDNTYTLNVNGKLFQMGNFYQKSIEELETQIATKPFPGCGTFNVFYGKNLDVAAFQADPAHDGAVFQVASNFNGLETVDQNQDITTQLITDYTGDPTQGPSASISAAPGLIFRRYFLFFDKNKPITEWGQNKNGERQVNFLKAITQQEKNDLPKMSQAGYVQFSNAMRMPHDDDYKQIKIGYHEKTAVTFGARSGHQHAVAALPYSLIDQVFAAAADFGGTNGALKNNTIAQAWAQKILNAAYQGALHCAFINNRKKVFLTLMGGGVFANDFSWICNAITRLKDFIQQSGLEVTLIWRDSFHNKIIVNALQPLVEQTGGHWTNCSGSKNDPLSDTIILAKKAVPIIKNPLMEQLSTLKEKLNKLKLGLAMLSEKLAALKKELK